MLDVFDRKRWGGRLLLLLVAVGIFLRVNRYLCNFPFWSDEAWVAVDAVSRSLGDILLHINCDLSFSVPAPGFMLVEKLSIMLLGMQETAFRFFPCLCGVGGVILFKRLLKGLVRPRVMLPALAFFVFSNLLIYYSSELKQYSSDVFFTVLVLVAHFRALKRSMDDQSTVTLLAAGILGLFFSLPIILVLCGLALVQIMVYYRRQQTLESGRYCLVLGLWLIMFMAMWENYYGVNYMREDVLVYQRPYYLSFPSHWIDWMALFRKLFSVFYSPVELSWPWLAAPMLAAGCWSLWRSDKALLLLLVMPIVFTVGLSMASHYPFYGRFLVFLLPIFFILIAQGIDYVMDGRYWRRMAGLAILVMLLVQPVARAVDYVVPVGETDIRSLIAYLHSHQKPGDSIYFNNDSQWGYKFYYNLYYRPGFATRASYSLQERGILYEHAVAGDAPGQLFNYLTTDQARYGRVCRRVYGWDRVLDEQGKLTRLPGGGRTWILLSQVSPEKERAFISCFDSFGIRLDTVYSVNASLYLYDLK